jgi:peptidoglycan/LPS O-acetylase OafA/YrhL
MGTIRFLLALSVLLEHIGPSGPLHLLGAHTAVQSFYIISGFYMALVLNEKYVGVNGSYTLFLGNRLLRLYPSYLVLLAIAIATQLLFRHYAGATDDALGRWIEQWGGMRGITRVLIAVPNVILFGLDSHVFLSYDASSGLATFSPRFTPTALYKFDFIPQAWSLGVELWFYLLAPLLVRRGVRILIAMAAASLGLRVAGFLLFGVKGDPWHYRFFPFELMFFTAGAIGYRAYAYLRERRMYDRRLAIAALVAVLAFMVAYMHLPAYKVDLFYYPLFAAAVPLLFMLSKDSRIDRYIGELSYPMYISHLLVLYVLTRLNWPMPLLAPLFTVAISIAVFELIDRPVERFRQNRTRRRKTLVEEPAPTLVAPGA